MAIESDAGLYLRANVRRALDVLPSQFITFRLEGNHRHASVPYFSGSGGVTPPGGNSGAPGSAIAGFNPDLRNDETRLTAALLVKL